VAGVYFIRHDLPFPVFDEKAVSKFDKTLQILTITLPVVPPPKAADIVSASALFESSTQPTTSSIVVDNPLLEKAASVKAVVVPIAPVAKSAKVKAVVVPVASVAKSSKVKAAVGLSFDGFNKCMKSFKRIRWNVDLHRKDSPDAGKGIFCLRPIKQGTCVALYSGHLVDAKGAVMVSCPSTHSLFVRLPMVQQPFSKGHGVKLHQVACPHVLIVDGVFEYAA
jgi:hypothetical protein